jgi:hypothetical protein
MLKKLEESKEGTRMWEIKKFKTAKARDKWIERHGSNYQFQEVFVNNAYALDVRKLAPIRMAR